MADTQVILSFAQERIMQQQRAFPTSPLNIATATRIHGPVDVQALERALHRMALRHEALRTRFVIDGHGECRLGTSHDVGSPIPLRVVDLRHPFSASDTRDDRRRRALTEAQQSARRIPVLAGGEVAWASLFTIDVDEHVFVLTAHRAICDAWSIERFHVELAAELRGESLPDVEVQLADFAAWQRDELAGPGAEPARAFWSKTLTDAPPRTLFPVDRGGDRADFPVDSSGREHTVAIDAATGAALVVVAERARTTPFTVLFSVFGALVARVTGQTDLLLGTPIALRAQAEILRTFGGLENALAIRIDASGDPAFDVFLARVDRALLLAYQNQEVPIERVGLGPEDSSRGDVPFQMSFGMGRAPSWLALAGIRCEPVPLDLGTASRPLAVTCVPAEDRSVRVTLSYATGLYDDTTMRELATRFASACDVVAQRSTLRLSEMTVGPRNLELPR